MLRRSRSVLGILDFVDRVGSWYKPHTMTSKDILHTPSRTNQPYDPVYNMHRLKQLLGPMKRRHHSNPESYMDTQETEKWMEVKHAAKLLGLKDNELATLSQAVLEQKWASLYKEKTFSQQQEVTIAVEVMMEYLDSELHRKKNREYYRTYVENARYALDAEQDAHKEMRKQNMYAFTAIMLLGGCCIVVIAAYLQGRLEADTIKKVGVGAGEYMGSLLTRPKNLEPAPDYGSRYRNTPSAMDMDMQSGDMERKLVNPTLARVMEKKAAVDDMEDALTVQLVNAENDAIRREQQEKDLIESTLFVHRKEDYDSEGNYKPETKKKSTDDVKESNPLRPTFSEFISHSAAQFGGSKTQRLYGNTMERVKEKELMEGRLRMVNPATSQQEESGEAAVSSLLPPAAAPAASS